LDSDTLIPVKVKSPPTKKKGAPPVGALAQIMDDDYEHYPHAYTFDDEIIADDNRAAKSMIQNESLSDMMGGG
jgi:hypothetical protein